MHNKELDVFRSKNSKILNEKRRLDSNSYQEFFSDILETSLEKGEEEIIKIIIQKYFPQLKDLSFQIERIHQ